MAEGLNSKIQMLKYRAHGYRNEKRFEAVILFHLGGLDLSPTHSKARRTVKVMTETFALDDIAHAYDRVANGDVRFRAVVLPNG